MTNDPAVDAPPSHPGRGAREQIPVRHAAPTLLGAAILSGGLFCAPLGFGAKLLVFLGLAFALAVYLALRNEADMVGELFPEDLPTAHIGAALMVVAAFGWLTFRLLEYMFEGGAEPDAWECNLVYVASLAPLAFWWVGHLAWHHMKGSGKSRAAARQMVVRTYIWWMCGYVASWVIAFALAVED